MRTHIAKALQGRCKAIRNAVKRYNAAAAELNPPRQPINWETVSHIHFLEEFHILHDTRQDIREKPWAQSAVRELMKVSLRVKRAHEEIQRCHIAVRRLYTAIQDETDLFGATLTRLRGGDPLAYRAVHDTITRRQRVNSLLLVRLAALTNFPDYQGECSHGVWVGVNTDVDTPGLMSVDSDNVADGVNCNNDNSELDADEADTLVGRLVDYISNLAISDLAV